MTTTLHVTVFQNELEALCQDNEEMVLQAAYRIIRNKEDAADDSTEGRRRNSRNPRSFLNWCA